MSLRFCVLTTIFFLGLALYSFCLLNVSAQTSSPELRITEIHYKTPEYTEVINTGSAAADVAELEFGDSGNTRDTESTSEGATTIASDEVFVIVRRADLDAFNSAFPSYQGKIFTTTIILNDGGDTASLVFSDQVIHSIEYTISATLPALTSGKSLQVVSDDSVSVEDQTVGEAVLTLPPPPSQPSSPPSPPSPPELRITEIHYKTPEYTEVVNTGSAAVDVAELEFGDSGNTRDTEPTSEGATTIASNEVFVIVKRSDLDAFNSAFPSYQGKIFTTTIALNDTGGDTAALVFSDQVIHSIEYTISATLPSLTSGKSLQVVSDDSVSVEDQTVGEAVLTLPPPPSQPSQPSSPPSPPSPPELRITEIHYKTPEYTEVVNTGSATVDIAELEFGDDKDAPRGLTSEGATTIASDEVFVIVKRSDLDAFNSAFPSYQGKIFTTTIVLNDGGDTASLVFSDQVIHSIEYTISATLPALTSGKSLQVLSDDSVSVEDQTVGEAILMPPPPPPELRITEIHYKTPEYTEVVNTGSAAVDVAELEFGDNNATRPIEPTSEGATTIASDEVFVIVKQGDLDAFNSAFPSYQGKIFTTTIALNDGGDTASLVFSEKVIHSITYTISATLPALTSGKSLQVVSDDSVSVEDQTVGEAVLTLPPPPQQPSQPSQPSQPPPPPELRITEIHYKTPEYTEVVNTGSAAVDVAELEFGDSGDTPRGLTSEGATTIASDEVFVIVRRADLAAFNSAFPSYQGKIFTTTIVLNDGGDTAALVFSDEVIHSIEYTISATLPALTSGKSLQVVSDDSVSVEDQTVGEAVLTLPPPPPQQPSQPSQPPPPPELRITEIHYKTPEYTEVVNTGSATVDIADLEFGDDKDAPRGLTSEGATTIASDEVFVIVRRADLAAFNSAFPSYQGKIFTTTIALNDGGDTAALVFSDQVIHSIDYSSSSLPQLPALTSGKSLQVVSDDSVSVEDQTVGEAVLTLPPPPSQPPPSQPSQPPPPPELRITEIHYKTPEYTEVVNTGSAAVDVAELEFGDSGDTRGTEPTSEGATTIASDEVFVIVRRADLDAFNSAFPSYQGKIFTTTIALNDGGDTAALVFSDQVIHSIDYSSSSLPQLPALTSGKSLQVVSDDSVSVEDQTVGEAILTLPPPPQQPSQPSQPSQPPPPPELRITEIHYKTPEYTEVVNTGSAAVDVAELEFGDSGNTRGTEPTSEGATTIASNEVFVIVRRADLDAFNSAFPSYQGKIFTTTIALNDGGDTAALVFSEKVIHSIDYSSSSLPQLPALTSGKSLQVLSDNSVSVEDQTVGEAILTLPPPPPQQPSQPSQPPPPPELRITEIHYKTPEYTEVVNTGSTAVDVAELEFGDNNATRPVEPTSEGAITIASNEVFVIVRRADLAAFNSAFPSYQGKIFTTTIVLNDGGDTAALVFSEKVIHSIDYSSSSLPQLPALTSGKSLQVLSDNSVSVEDQTVGEAILTLPPPPPQQPSQPSQPPPPPELRITEIHYKTPEYTEVVNTGSATVDVAELEFGDNNATRPVEPTSEGATTIASNEVFVIVRRADLAAFNSAFPSYQGKIFTTTIVLNDGGDTAALVFSDQVIHSIDYSSSSLPQLPALTSGKSLQVVSDDSVSVEDQTVGEAVLTIPPPPQQPSQPPPSQPPPPPELRITEIHYKTPEYTEVINTGSAAVDIAELMFRDNSNTNNTRKITPTSEGATTIASDEVFVIVRRADLAAFNSAFPSYQGKIFTTTIVLNDGGDTAALVFSDEVIHSIEYTISATLPALTSGKSLQVVSDDSVSVEDQTVGEAVLTLPPPPPQQPSQPSQPPPPPELRITEIHYKTPEYTEVVNTGSATVDIADLEFGDDKDAPRGLTSEGATTIASDEVFVIVRRADLAAFNSAFPSYQGKIFTTTIILNDGGDTAALVFSDQVIHSIDYSSSSLPQLPALTSGKSLQVVSDDSVSVEDQTVGEAVLTLPPPPPQQPSQPSQPSQPPPPPELRITEIHYKTPEYTEVINTGSATVDVAELEFGDSGNTRGTEPTSEGATTIASNEVFVIVRRADLAAFNSAFPSYQGKIFTTTIVLNDGGDTAALVFSDQVIHSIAYSPPPTLTSGKSLQVVSDDSVSVEDQTVGEAVLTLPPPPPQQPSQPSQPPPPPELRITEIHYKTPEYTEVVNTGSTTVDVAELMFGDNNATRPIEPTSEGATTIASDEVFVIVRRADLAAFNSAFPSYQGKIFTTTIALNDGGDTAALVFSDQVIHSITYTISATLPSLASGKSLQVVSDDSVSVEDQTVGEAILTLPPPPSQPSLPPPSQPSQPPTSSSQSSQPSLPQSSQSSQLPTSSSQSSQPSQPPSPPSPPELRITEIHYKTPEYTEVVNIGSAAVDVAELMFGDDKDTPRELTSEGATTIASNEVFVIVRRADLAAFNSAFPSYQGKIFTTTIVLNDGGDTAALVFSDQVIHSIDYSSSSLPQLPALTSGKSLQVVSGDSVSVEDQTVGEAILTLPPPPAEEEAEEVVEEEVEETEEEEIEEEEVEEVVEEEVEEIEEETEKRVAEEVVRRSGHIISRKPVRNRQYPTVRQSVVIGGLTYYYPKPIENNFFLGGVGREVQILQNFLVRQGFLTTSFVYGLYDNATRDAVIRYQETYQNSIFGQTEVSYSTGYFDALTRMHVNALRRLEFEEVVQRFKLLLERIEALTR